MTRQAGYERLESGVLKLGEPALIVAGDSIDRAVGLADPNKNPLFRLITLVRWPSDPGGRAYGRRWHPPFEDKPAHEGSTVVALPTRSILSPEEVELVTIADGKVWPPHTTEGLAYDPIMKGHPARAAAELIVERFAADARIPGGILIVS